MKKLGIIVPYRNRYEQLNEFKREIVKYLEDKKIDYEVFVIEQDDGKSFNRGKLLNVGFTYAEKAKCDYVVFHDLDMIPVNVSYRYSNKPIHLATSFVDDNDFTDVDFQEYFGGVTMFPSTMFKAINGYSNEYWGWGFEDDDLLYRCKINNLPLDVGYIDTVGANTAALEFNGYNAYIRGKRSIRTNSNFTIVTSFQPGDLELNPDADSDSYTVFSLPGYDFKIHYSSFRRYGVQLFDSKKEFHQIYTDILPAYKTVIVVTWDEGKKELSLYQDGKLAGQINIPEGLYNYNQEEHFYLGCSVIPGVNTKVGFFKGIIDYFATYTKCLGKEEIVELSKNQHFGLTHKFGDYDSSDSLTVYYDAKFIKDYRLINLLSEKNPGVINNCSVVPFDYEAKRPIVIPFRRESTFRLLKHDSNGFLGTRWKDDITRYNQLKFTNEVVKGHRDTKSDGLSNLYFEEHSNTKIKNQHHIVVGI